MALVEPVKGIGAGGGVPVSVALVAAVAAGLVDLVHDGVPLL